MQRQRFLTGLFVLAACGIVRAQPFQLNDPAILAATRPKSSGDITSGLIVWFKLTEGSGTTANDSSGTSNTGTVHGTGPTWGTGYLTLNGFDNYISTANLNNVPHVTECCWINIVGSLSPKETPIAFSNGFANGTNDKLLYINTTNLFFSCYIGSQITTGTPSSAVPTNSWAFIAGTWDGSNAYTYINGSQVGAVSGSGDSYTGYTVPNIFIGEPVSAGAYFNGSIRDVRVYNRALSSTEIATLYSNGPRN